MSQGLGLLESGTSTAEEPKQGFWSKVKSAFRSIVTSIVSEVPFAGGFLSDWLDEFLSNQGWRLSDSELTTFENSQVDMWIETRFKPFFLELCRKVEYTGYGTLRTSELPFVTTVNEIRELMAVALAYNLQIPINVNNPIGSERIMNAKAEIMNLHFQGLNAFIDSEITAKSLVLFSNETIINASEHSFLSGTWQLSWENKQVEVSYNKLSVNENGETSPPRPTDTTTPTPTKRNTWLKVAAVLGISYVIGKAVSRKSK
jgi:hypothetical protein